MPACPAIVDTAFLTSSLSYVDCQATTIGEQGYIALAASGSSPHLLLGGALTIYIALIGYRMMLGEVPTVRAAVVAAAKIGMVLILATSWPAFRVLAYDVALNAPSELAGNIAQSTGLASGDGLVRQLQALDGQITELTVLGVDEPPPLVPGIPNQGGELDQIRFTVQTPQNANRPRWDPARDASVLTSARTVFLTATIGAFAAVRLIAGLLLALAPLFAPFLLFDGTRSLFEGWLRALVAAALGALAINVLLRVEVALTLPWLASIIELRHAKIAAREAPVELLALSLVFAVTLLAALFSAARIGQAFRLAPISARILARVDRAASGPVQSLTRPAAAPNDIGPGRSRVLAIADAVATHQRRDVSVARQPGQTIERSTMSVGARGVEGPDASAPLGQSFRRRTTSRVSAGARRRDGTA